MFFLIMLLLFGAMIPFMLHLFGVHCNYDGEIVKTSPLALTSNLRIAFIDADEVYNKSSYLPESLSVAGVPVESCRKPVCYDNETDAYYFESSSVCDNKTIIYPYLTTQASWSRCITCDGDINGTHIVGYEGTAFTDVYLCFGDAHRIPEDEMNWYQSWSCDPDSRCIPPEHYYYEYDTGTYDCEDLDICGVNVTNDSIVPVIDEELKSVGAELMYPNQEFKDYRSAILFKCDKSLKPQITLYGLPVFNYKVWLLIMVISILVTVMTRLKPYR